jgi:hypothetical protein
MEHPPSFHASKVSFGSITTGSSQRNQTVALDIVRRPKSTPVQELERYMRCPVLQLSCLRHYGLLRGACHRARIRATRWLAMTIRERAMLETPLR